MEKMIKQNHLIENLLKEHLPVVAWDWDGTLSINGVHARPELVEIISKLTSLYSLTNIIVTGRTEFFIPLDYSSRAVPIRVFYNVGDGSPFKFKLWILNKLYNKGEGILRMYIDNDEELLDVLRKSNLPVCDAKSTNLSWFVNNLKIFRQIEGKERERKRSQ